MKVFIVPNYARPDAVEGAHALEHWLAGQGVEAVWAHDKKRFPDILQAGTPTNPYYTNSSQLPVSYTDDPFEALAMQEDLQKKYTGGTVLHLYMEDAVSSSNACKQIVRRALTNFRLPYITITPTFSICPKHGYISGRHDFCPICDAELISQKLALASKCQTADCPAEPAA